MKVIAMYLPQFHQIKENDEWWGEGYTEWTAVRKAEPLFPGHQQPQVPLGNYYYDLLKKDTLKRQCNWAKRYGIDVFCFYHYWFGSNRLILEKPAENLLKWTDIDMPFCFCWDSSNWARTWSKLGNAWADKFEPSKSSVEKNGLLMEQYFGDEEYWRNHFEYLLPFFKDSRYLSLEGKPVFIFYNSAEISCLARMIDKWRKWAIKEGLLGLYIIGFHLPHEATDAVILPMAFSQRTLGYDKDGEYRNTGSSLRLYSYDEVWKKYLLRRRTTLQRTLWLGTVSFDDTPRRGMNGRVYVGQSPKKFEKYFGELYKKSLKEQNPFVFLDAWNEWGEGKKLEPDEINRYEYLEAVRCVVSNYNCPVSASYNEEKIEDEDSYIKSLEKQIVKYFNATQLLENWMIERKKKMALEKYLKSKGFNRIAVYGYGKYGKLFLEELLGSNVVVEYLIDLQKDAMQGKTSIKIYSPEEKFPNCDAIVVTVVDEYYNILNGIGTKTNVPIISLHEIIDAAGKYSDDI